jgi:hypothetical protein
MKSLDYYNSFWYRFTRPIKRLWFKFLLNRDKLIKVDERHRGVGKTYMMIERAIKEDIPIVVGNQQQAYLIKRDGNPVEVLRLAKNFTIDFKGKHFPNGVMIDESVDPTMIPFIEGENIKIRGGFIRNYRGDKANES